MRPASVNGPGTGIFTGPRAYSLRMVFGDSSQTVGSRQRLQAAVPLTLVMRGGAPVADTTSWLEAAQVLVKAEVEIDPLRLAIGDSIEPCPQLVVNGQPHGVANRFLPIDRAEKAGCEPTSPNFSDSIELQ